jgi:hypothetical protein
MADSKISQLTAITAMDLAGADVLPVVDTSATTTKSLLLVPRLLPRRFQQTLTIWPKAQQICTTLRLVQP